MKKEVLLKIGAWNVRTLLDRKEAERPERRTAFVAKELARYKIDIAALSETRLAEEGQLIEQSAGYTFSWIGKKNDAKREAGVGFAIKTSLTKKKKKQVGPPKDINERLMITRIPLSRKRHATVISAYAPTMTNPDEAKESFYEDLEIAMGNTPSADKLIILGDFNARVGADWASWDGVLGKHGIKKCNRNGDLLLETCASFNLTITNTIFQLPHRSKTSWMPPRSKHWHLLDYFIVRQRDRQDVRVTKTMCGAECWTDHRLVVSKMRLRILSTRRPEGKIAPKRFNVLKRKNELTRQCLVSTIDTKLAPLNVKSSDIERNGATFRDAMYSATHEVVGVAERKHQDWFDEKNAEVQALLIPKHMLDRAYLNDPNSVKRRCMKTSRGMFKMN